MNGDGAITFWVPGVPAPGGSKRAFAHAQTGKIVVIDDCKRNTSWRERVASFAWEAMRDRPGGVLTGPLVLECLFIMPRPRYHYGKGKNARRLLPSAPKYHTIAPDTTKLVRAAEDSLRNICWHDDAQVVRQIAEKAYGDRPGARVAVRRLGDGDGDGEGDGDGAG